MTDPLWTIRCYLDDKRNDVIDAWRQQQPEELQAKFDERVRYLRAQPRERWVRPYFDTLKGNCKGLGEIRFKYNNVQYRPLGFFSGKLEFTLVFIAQEKGGRFDPLSACEQGLKRKLEIEADRSRANDCDLE